MEVVFHVKLIIVKAVMIITSNAQNVLLILDYLILSHVYLVM